MMSARRTWSGRFCVRLWQMVTVALRSSSNPAIGLPRIALRPMTTACLPSMATSYASSSRMIPPGVALQYPLPGSNHMLAKLA